MEGEVLIKIQDIETGQVYDISEAISRLDITFHRKGQASQLKAKLHKKQKIYIPKGSKIMVYVNEKEFYKGYFAENEINMWTDADIVCYDQLNYLVKNKWSYNFRGMSATQILTRIANDFGLTLGECDDTGYGIGNGNYPNFNMTLMDMVSKALTHTLYNTGRLYTLIDDFGKLRIVLSDKLIADNQLLPGSNILSYRYKGSINKNTYNSIKVLYDSSGETMIGPTAVATDGTIQKWGRLQLVVPMDEMLGSEGGFQRQANNLLKLYNREYKQIQIRSIGDASCRGGTYGYTNIGTIDNTEIKRELLINKVTHTFINGQHTMDMDTLDINMLTGG